MNKLIPLMLFVLYCVPAAAQQPPVAPPIPTDLTFRPRTFARPSRAIRNFRLGSEYYSSYAFSHSDSYFGARNLSTIPFSSSLSPEVAGRSYYYKSVIGNYGANPYSGLDASRRLYSTPISLPAPSYGGTFTDPYYVNQTYNDGWYLPQRGH